MAFRLATGAALLGPLWLAVDHPWLLLNTHTLIALFVALAAGQVGWHLWQGGRYRPKFGKRYRWIDRRVD
ncbi:MAG: hypothetical protein AAF253_07465 [Pseudomonadota bacterium]